MYEMMIKQQIKIRQFRIITVLHTTVRVSTDPKNAPSINAKL